MGTSSSTQKQRAAAYARALEDWEKTVAAQETYESALAFSERPRGGDLCLYWSQSCAACSCEVPMRTLWHGGCSACFFTVSCPVAACAACIVRDDEDDQRGGQSGGGQQHGGGQPLDADPPCRIETCCIGTLAILVSLQVHHGEFVFGTIHEPRFGFATPATTLRPLPTRLPPPTTHRPPRPIAGD